MSWPVNSGPWTPGIAVTQDMNMGSYTADQWTAMQQQNWQQWAQWQQQYAQWQSQYGEKYAQQMQAMQVMGGGGGLIGIPPLPAAGPPPAPPPPDNPPPPPPHENNQPLYSQNNTTQPVPVPAPGNRNNTTTYNNSTGNNQNWSYEKEQQQQQAPVNAEALKKLAEEERLFDIQFQKWEEEIDKWRRENVNHPDKQAYEEYEAKFESCRLQLLERRAQMNQKRAKLLGGATPAAANATVNAGNISTAIPPPLQNNSNYNMPNNAQSQSYNNKPNNFNSNDQTYKDYNKNSGMIRQQDRRGSNYEGYDNSNYNRSKNVDPQDRYESYENMKDYSQQENYGDDSNSSFLPQSTGKGIPGLDLVAESEKAPQLDEDVIEITSDPSQNRGVPDYSTISKGINNILGDEKLMNILSSIRGQAPPGPPPQSRENVGHGGTSQSYNNPPPNNWNRNNDQSQWNKNNDNNQWNRNNDNNQWNYNNEYNQFDNKQVPPNSQQQDYRQNQSQNSNYKNYNDGQQGGQDQWNYDEEGNYGQENYGDEGNYDGEGNYGDDGNYNQDDGSYNQDGNYNRDINQRAGPPPRSNMPPHRGNVPPQRGNVPPQRGNMIPPRGNVPSPGNGPAPRPLMDINSTVHDNYNNMNQTPVVPPPRKPIWVEQPLFTPSIIVEYDHQPLRGKARDFIEPVHMFDYNHKSKDGDTKKCDYEKEVDEMYGRKPREDDYDRYRRDREYHRQSEREDDRYSRDQSRQFERRAPSDYPTHDYYRQRPPRDDFNDRRYPESRFDDRKREDRDRNRRDEIYRDRERDSYRDSERERERDRDRERDRGRERDRDRNRDSRRSRSRERDNRKRARSKESPISLISEESIHSKKSKDLDDRDSRKHMVMIDDILEPPGRDMRPAKIVIILRGPPGSGKSYLAKLIRDREAEFGGTVRIMSIDDYFMQEGEVEETDPATGKIVKKPSLKYEYDSKLEETYENSLKRAFKRSCTDGYFSFLIYDAVNDHLKSYADIWNYARQNGFQVYVCTMELDAHACYKRNIHNRSLEEIQVITSRFFPTPSHHIQLDPTTLLQSAGITEVHMEDVDSDDVIMEDVQDERGSTGPTSRCGRRRSPWRTTFS
ncbi:myb-like protein AA isoform X2 [Amyelois transitella]|uniref:myb-like protein AA isoform X2 n=1 Tax=Amyelois transitella TaxID=680683 RepID=UPI00298FB483|nr:myb-like protein AA isoform X2 [Amyelois transitella]XP_060804054.1 myb-like protein AA isoform X2 [Amyelois transitella]